MENKKSVLVPVLILSTFAASALAVYFWVQLNQAQHRTDTIVRGDSALHAKEQESVDRVDSLLFQGDYARASTLALELNQGQSFNDDSPLSTRYRLANSLMKLGKTNQKLRDRLKESDSLTKDTLNVDKSEDSLVNLLQETRVEVSNLKQKLSNNPVSDYLRFKTSKGTSLHYVGATTENKANGFGIALLETGSRYEGQWKNNQRHGYGKFFWDDGEQYEGEYKNDKREGIGTYYWDNGEKYIGEWKDDRRNGEGKFYNRRGKLKTSGIWKDDKLVEEK